jgi:hypothetical protein
MPHSVCTDLRKLNITVYLCGVERIKNGTTLTCCGILKGVHYAIRNPDHIVNLTHSFVDALVALLLVHLGDHI